MSKISIKYLVSIKITKISATIPEDIREEEVLLDDYLSNTICEKEVYNKVMFLADTKQDAEELACQLEE